MYRGTGIVSEIRYYTFIVHVHSTLQSHVTKEYFLLHPARNECVLATDPLVTPCVNGFCVDGFNTYTCLCYDGYTGRNCDVEGITEYLVVIKGVFGILEPA